MSTILNRNKNSYEIVKNGGAAIYQINFKASVIMKEFVGFVFNLYTGKQYYILPITNLMFGFKFGWFGLYMLHTFLIGPDFQSSLLL